MLPTFGKLLPTILTLNLKFLPVLALAAIMIGYLNISILKFLFAPTMNLISKLLLLALTGFALNVAIRPLTACTVAIVPLFLTSAMTAKMNPMI